MRRGVAYSNTNVPNFGQSCSLNRIKVLDDFPLRQCIGVCRGLFQSAEQLAFLNRSEGHSTEVPNSHCCRCGLPSSLVYCALAVHPCIYLGSACGSNARCRHGRKCASCGSSEGRTCGGAQATLGKRLRPNEGLDTHHGRAQISREKDGEKKGRRGGLLWCWARVLAREEKLNRDHQDPGRVRGPSRVM